MLAGVLVLSSFVPVIAQDEEPTSEPTTRPTVAKAEPTTAAEKTAEDTKKAVEELKDKVESKVTELKNNNLKTKSGFIVTIKDNKVSVDSEAGAFDIAIDPDVTTVYRISGASRSEIKADDLEKGDYILVSGPEIGNEVTANTIYVDEHYISKSGKIIEVNSDDFYIKILTAEKDNYTIDIERATTSQILDIKTLELSTAGFTKLKEGDNIHFTAKRSMDKKQARFSALKTIIIPQEYFIK